MLFFIDNLTSPAGIIRNWYDTNTVDAHLYLYNSNCNKYCRWYDKSGNIELLVANVNVGVPTNKANLKMY